jgi:hypothetical protein
MKNGSTMQPLAHAESAVTMLYNALHASVGFAAARRGDRHKLFELHADATFVPPRCIHGALMSRQAGLAGAGAGAGCSASMRDSQGSPAATLRYLVTLIKCKRPCDNFGQELTCATSALNAIGITDVITRFEKLFVDQRRPLAAATASGLLQPLVDHRPQCCSTGRWLAATCVSNLKLGTVGVAIFAGGQCALGRRGKQHL